MTPKAIRPLRVSGSVRDDRARGRLVVLKWRARSATARRRSRSTSTSTSAATASPLPRTPSRTPSGDEWGQMGAIRPRNDETGPVHADPFLLFRNCVGGGI